MNPDRQQAINYLRAPANGMWKWAENGAVVVWRDGTSIAFKEEIIQLIEWLAPNGLPPFGAIVFLLSACRGKICAVSEIVTQSKTPLPSAMGYDAKVLTTARNQLQAQLEAALAQLAKVSRLPEEIRVGLKAKCVLAEAVFEPAKAERHVDARTILSGLRELFNDAELSESDPGTTSGSYIRQIHMVAEELKLHTPESLALRLRTGLDALPKEIDANLPTAERARRLIEELSRDREFGPVARAAKELMAAVRLPRRLGEREQLAIGGVADITNRGPLDRLLLSELAHDDLTLSVRVALNEALYLRREPPTREPPGTLALLLDSGVRLWGMPRVLGTAVALALIARDKQHSKVLAWRAHGKQLQSVDLLTRNGLTQHLGALEPTVHPGECLPAFAAAVAAGDQNQSVLITHRDALGDPELRRVLAENPSAPAFVVTVDRKGRFELHALPLAHRPALCEADLNLAAVFSESAGVTLIKTDVDVNLPVIFGMSPFPFLLPLSGKTELWAKGADGFSYAVLNDRRLVRFRDHQFGACVLVNELPGGRPLWIDCDGTDVHLLKGGSNMRQGKLLSVTLPNSPLRSVDTVAGSDTHAVHRYGDAILVIRPHEVRAYALSDGRMLAKVVNPHPWVNGRFFRGTSHFYFAVWDGENIKFEPVTMPIKYRTLDVLAIFEREGMAGPWLVTRNREVISTETGEVIKLPNLPELMKEVLVPVVSRDGHRLLFKGSQSQGRLKDILIELKPAVKVQYITNGITLLNPSPYLPNWNVYRVIECVKLFEDGVAICGRKNRLRKLAMNNGKLCMMPQVTPGTFVPEPAFTEPAKKTKYGCLLQTHEFKEGSKMFLDSRGLLHLKSSDPTLPEVSILLAAGEVAAWTSDGVVCGPPFFFDGPIVSEPGMVFDRILKFFNRL